MVKCIQSICRTSTLKLRNVIQRQLGTTVVLVTVFVLCLNVPSLHVAPKDSLGRVDFANSTPARESDNQTLEVKQDAPRSQADRKRAAELEAETARKISDVVTKRTAFAHRKRNRYLTKRGRRIFKMVGRRDVLKADDKCKRTLPDAIIIGVMKAGTEAFSTFLAINPQVAMSLNVKSTLFFSEQYSKGLDWYRSQMTCKTSGNQITIEKAPQYFAHPMAPNRIFSMNRHIKLVLLVRNPIDRAISHYLQVKSAHPKRIKGKSFEDKVFRNDGGVNRDSPFITVSKYSTILRQWLKYFRLSQIHIVDGDKFKDNQVKMLSETESFLGIKHHITEDKFVYDKDKGFYCLKGKEGANCLNSGKGRKHPKLSSSDYHKLHNFFKPYNEMFFKMVGKRFDW